MYNKHIRRLSDQLSLFNIDFLLAVLALEIINDGTFNHLLKAIHEAGAVSHGHTQGVESFKSITNITTLGAFQLGTDLASENIIQ
jgi:hypothetical protein